MVARVMRVRKIALFITFKNITIALAPTLSKNLMEPP